MGEEAQYSGHLGGDITVLTGPGLEGKKSIKYEKVKIKTVSVQTSPSLITGREMSSAWLFSITSTMMVLSSMMSPVITPSQLSAKHEEIIISFKKTLWS